MAFDDGISGALNTPAPNNPAPAPNTSGESEISSARPLPLNTQPEQASNMDVGNLTPPAASPAPAQPLNFKPAQPPVQEDRTPGAFFHHLSRAFAGSVLGALAGPKQMVDGYDVDSNGKMTPRLRDLTGRERLQLVASAALQGLSAGSQVGPQKSGGASIASGLGAGFVAQQQRQQQQDLLKRQQATEDYERSQKQLMEKAVRAMHNASTYSLWAKAMQEAQDHDPERQKNIDLMNSVQDYISRNPTSDMSVQIVTPEQMRAIQQQDAHTIAQHTFLPIGMKMLNDAQGQPVYDSNGNPRQVGQIVMISGTDGKVPLPKSYIDDIQKYKAYVPNLKAADSLQPDSEIPLMQFLGLDKALNGAKIQEIDGWKNAITHVDPKTGVAIQENPFTHETRPMPAGDTKETAGIKKEEAEARQKNAEATAAGFGLTGPAAASGTGPTGEDFLKTLPAGLSAEVRGFGEGRLILTPAAWRSPKNQTLVQAILRAYPNYDVTKAPAYADMRKKFTSGPEAKGINSFNTALNHLSRMYDHVSWRSTVPGVSYAERKLFGNEDAAALRGDRAAVATELTKAYAQGQISEKEVAEWRELLDTASPTELRNNVKEVARLLMGKLDAYQNQWESGMPSPEIVAPFKIVSTQAAAAYAHITGESIAGQPAPAPAPTPTPTKRNPFRPGQ